MNTGKGDRNNLVLRETVIHPCYFLYFYTVNLASFILGQRQEVFQYKHIIWALFHLTGVKDAVSATWERNSQCSDILCISMVGSQVPALIYHTLKTVVW